MDYGSGRATLGNAGYAETACAEVRQNAFTEIASRLRNVLGSAAEVDITLDDFHSRLTDPRPQEVMKGNDALNQSGVLFEINGIIDQIDARLRSAIGSASRLREIA